MRTNDEGRQALRAEDARPEPDPRAADALTGYVAPGLQSIEPSAPGEDAARDETMHALIGEPARPLTDEEKEAEEDDPTPGDRVYAPASARVPKEPAPGDDKLLER